MIQAQNLRQIKLRIKSIASTRKITKAMEMISASKLSGVKTSLAIREVSGTVCAADQAEAFARNVLRLFCLTFGR